MKTRDEMIKELTEYEIRWILENYSESDIDGMATFFAEGGFNNYDDEKLKAAHEFNFGKG